MHEFVVLHNPEAGPEAYFGSYRCHTSSQSREVSFNTLTMSMHRLLFLLAVVSSSFVAVVEGAISAQCTNQTALLRNNTALYNARPSPPDCVIYSGRDSCTVDFRDTGATFANLCIDVGGQFFKENFTFSCTQFSETVKLTVLGQPFCSGAACTEAESAEYFDVVVFPGLDDILVLQRYQCDSMSTPVSAATGCTTGAASALLSAASLAVVIALHM